MEVLARGVQLAIAGLELGAALAGVGIRLAVDPLAEDAAAVGQGYFGHGGGPEHAQAVPHDHGQQEKDQRQHPGQRRGGRPDLWLAPPPKTLGGGDMV